MYCFLSGEEDLPQIYEKLRNLSTQNIYDLGLSLGLKYPNLQIMKNLPEDMLAAWMQQEDMMSRNPTTWTVLASALESIGQTSAGLRVKDTRMPYDHNN